MLQPIDANDDAFWDQFWSDSIANVQDIFTLVTAQEIRTLRDEAPSNLATLSIKVNSKFDQVILMQIVIVIAYLALIIRLTSCS